MMDDMSMHLKVFPLDEEFIRRWARIQFARHTMGANIMHIPPYTDFGTPK